MTSPANSERYQHHRFSGAIISPGDYSRQALPGALLAQDTRQPIITGSIPTPLDVIGNGAITSGLAKLRRALQ
jgi:hypothetical protein